MFSTKSGKATIAKQLVNSFPNLNKLNERILERN